MPPPVRVLAVDANAFGCAGVALEENEEINQNRSRSIDTDTTENKHSAVATIMQGKKR